MFLIFFLNINPDISGYLTREIGFKKFFNKLYQDFLNFHFIEECNNWTFTQKLYHFMRDDINFKLGICDECHNNRCDFNNFKIGYKRFCCINCVVKNEDVLNLKKSNIISKYGSFEKFYSIRTEHTITSNQLNYSVDYFTNRKKAKQTFNEKYNVNSYMSTPEFKEKTKKYYKENFGVEHNMQLEDVKQKALNTKTKRHTFNTSKIEEDINNYFIYNNISFQRQYNSDNRYPFACDFYLTDFDLFIEINAFKSHNTHPFNPNDKNDIKILNNWKSHNTEFYNNCIYTWTVRDPLKRKTAKENNLNYLEIFSSDLNECIKIILEKIKELKGDSE